MPIGLPQLITEVVVKDAGSAVADHVAAALDRLSAAEQRAQAAAESSNDTRVKSTRAFETVSRALAVYEGRVTPAVAATQALTKGFNLLERGVALGAISVEKATSIYSQHAVATAELINQTNLHAKAEFARTVAMERSAQAARNAQEAFNTVLGVGASRGSASAAAFFAEAAAEAEAEAKAVASLAQRIRDFTEANNPALAVQRQWREGMAEANNLMAEGAISGKDYETGLRRIAAAADAATNAENKRAKAMFDTNVAEERSKQFAANAQQAFNGQLGVNPGSGAGTAAASASVFQESVRATEEREAALEKLNTRTRAFVDLADPAAAAQRRFDEAVAEGNDLLGRGAISQQQFVAGVARLQEGIDGTSTKVRRFSGFLGLNRQGLLELQAAGINTFQALAAGINPVIALETEAAQVLGALIQGQFFDKFGGFKAVLLSIGAPIAALVGGLTAFAIAIIKGQREMAAFRRESQLTANAAGLTASAYNGIAVAAASAGNIGVATARQVVLGFAQTGRIGADVTAKLTKMTADYAAATGKSAAEAGAELAQLFARPERGAKELEERYNLLTRAQREEIRVLIEQGQYTKAQVELSDALNLRTQNLANTGLTWLDHAWRAVANTASAAWDAMKGVGRGVTLEDQLARAKQQAQDYPIGPYSGAYAQKGIDSLQAQVDAERRAAAASETSAALQEQVKQLDDVNRAYQSVTTKQKELTDQSVKYQNALKDLNAQISELNANPAHGGTPGLSADKAVLEQGLAATNRELAAVRSAADAARAQTRIAAAGAGVGPAQRGVVTAYQSALDSAQHGGTDDERAHAFEIAQQAAARATIQLNQAIADQNKTLEINLAETRKVTEAYGISVIAGMKAEAARQAAQDAFQTGVNKELRARQLLAQAVAGALEQGAKEVQQLEAEAGLRQSIADAAQQGVARQRGQELEVRIATATKPLADALQTLPQDSPERTKALAEIERMTAAIRKQDAADREIAFQESIRGQKDEMTLAQANLGLMEVTESQRVLGLAHIHAEIEARNLGLEIGSKEYAQYVANADALAQINLAYEQQKAALEDVQQAGLDVFHSLQSTLSTFVKTGKVDFAGLIDSINSSIGKLVQTDLENYLFGDGSKPSRIGVLLEKAGGFLGLSSGAVGNAPSVNQLGALVGAPGTGGAGVATGGGSAGGGVGGVAGVAGAAVSAVTGGAGGGACGCFSTATQSVASAVTQGATGTVRAVAGAAASSTQQIVGATAQQTSTLGGFFVNGLDALGKGLQDFWTTLFGSGAAGGGGGGGGILGGITNILGLGGSGSGGLGLQNIFTSGGSGLLGGLFGANTIVGGAGASVLSAIGSIFHSGGVVGKTAVPTRAVSASVFHNAPRYHEGLFPGEFPAILQQGETVIPAGGGDGMGGFLSGLGDLFGTSGGGGLLGGLSSLFGTSGGGGLLGGLGSLFGVGGGGGLLGGLSSLFGDLLGGGGGGVGGMFSSLLGGAGKVAGSLGGGLGSSLGGIGGLFGFHSGGVAGTTSAMLAGRPIVYMDVPRYHNGTYGAGLASDEIPAILKRGESVRTPIQERELHARMANSNDKGARTVSATLHIHGVTNIDDFRKSKSQIEREIGIMTQRAMARNG